MQCQPIKTAISLLVLTAVLNSSPSWADEWKLEKQKMNVSISSKKTESGYKEILVKTIVEAPPQALVTLLNDVAFSSKWIYNCIEVKIVEEYSPTERIINSFFSAPWPVKDREMVVLSKTTFKANGVQIQLTDSGDSIPKHTDYVRMQNMHGLWEATTLEDGKTEITYFGGGNPGGNLPVFIANKELITSMFKTFQNLNSVILLEKYQPKKLTD